MATYTELKAKVDNRRKSLVDHLESKLLEASKRRNLKLWNALLGQCGQHQQLALARRVFASIGNPNDWSYIAFISALCRCGAVDEALRTLRARWLIGKVEVVGTTAVCNALCKAGRLAEALALTKDMGELGVHPNVRTHNALLRGCAREGDAKAAQTIAKAASKAGETDDATQDSLLRALAVGWAPKALRKRVRQAMAAGSLKLTAPAAQLVAAALALQNHGKLAQSALNAVAANGRVQQLGSEMVDFDRWRTRIQSGANRVKPRVFKRCKRTRAAKHILGIHAEHFQQTLGHFLEEGEVWIDIGAGDGEWLMATMSDDLAADRHAQRSWIAVDVRYDRCWQEWAASRMNLPPLKVPPLIVCGDALVLLRKMDDASLGGASVNFPEPFGEVTRPLLRELLRVLQPGRTLTLLSDSEHVTVEFLQATLHAERDADLGGNRCDRWCWRSTLQRELCSVDDEELPPSAGGHVRASSFFKLWRARFPTQLSYCVQLAKRKRKRGREDS